MSFRCTTALLLAFVSGCGGVTTRYVDRAGVMQRRTLRGPAAAAAIRASNEIPCPIPVLVVRELGSGGFQVDGCDHRMTYLCLGATCTAEAREGFVDAPPTASARPVQTAPAPEATEADRAARAAVDARAPAILACVEDTALSFELSWNAEGNLDASLRGERHGTPEEGCVRAIVQALSITAPGRAGTAIHAVQR